MAFPGTVGSFRVKFDTAEVHIQDLRGREVDFNLDKQGFQLLRHTSVEKDFKDEHKIKSVIYPETEALLKSV